MDYQRCRPEALNSIQGEQPWGPENFALFEKRPAEPHSGKGSAFESARERENEEASAQNGNL